ncbi:UNVERIFIED_CONTAM: hypothetical protein PYX00_002181 [Menopon gallinae]|uniref:E2F/DP family winged-helix DNA-binding domain-containing protein n=1 Tax=Menopon gallinae TaxID=328185 RepID=A0AAW2IFF2_9NEOP
MMTDQSYTMIKKEAVTITPNINTIKQEVPTEHTSPMYHLLDHGYGQTPQNQIIRLPSRSDANLVKRRLNLDGSISILPPSEFKTPNSTTPGSAKRMRFNSVASVASVATQVSSPSPTSKGKHSNRYDTSLGLLTRRFVTFTNVLEGIGILEKKSKNNIQWRGSPRGIDFHDVSGSQEDSPKNNVMLELRRREEELNRLISNAEMELKQLTEDKRFAYVTYEDLRTIPSYKNQTVMVIKAPPEAKLRVPDPSKVLQMYIKSENSEIEVFICPEEVDDCPPAPAPEKVKNSPVRPSGSHIGPSIKEEPTSENSDLGSDLSRYKNVLISDSDDFGPMGGRFQLQTEDQNQGSSGICTDLVGPINEEQFLALEPPPIEDDYLFSLGPEEGLTDLFDLTFDLFDSKRKLKEEDKPGALGEFTDV